MGGCMSLPDRIQPQEVKYVDPISRSLHSASLDEAAIRNPLKHRNTTDVLFLVLMAAFFIVLVLLLGYCVLHGDLYRLLNGYDNCANVCGVQNYKDKDERFGCKGLDFKKDPFLLIRNAGGSKVDKDAVFRQCVSNCSIFPGYRQFLNRCIPERGPEVVNSFFSRLGWGNFFQEVAEDFLLCWKEVVYLCLGAIGLSILLIILLRFFVGIVVWFVLIGVAVSSLVGTIYLWVLYKETEGDAKYDQVSDMDARKHWTYLLLAIAATIVTACVIFVIIYLRKRIQLVVQLFVEAGKAVGAMPLILLQPSLTVISLALVIAGWFYFCLWIQSAGKLTFLREEFFTFEPDVFMKIARWWNLFSMLWMTQFIVGCQHMVVAGAVATWYYTRNKTQLGNPILYSTYLLVRYHLGSVCLGSLLIAVVQLLRLILTVIQKYLRNTDNVCASCVLRCCECCMCCFEKSLKYLTRNAYIEIAMYGHSFCLAGRQAFRILVANGMRVTVINSIGDFVLFFGKVLVVLATVLIGTEVLGNKEGVQHVWVPLVLVGAFAYFIAHCCVTIYEMVIDTIFLCFCEDCEQNDGIARPYFMSKGLMEFVENSKKAVEKNELGQQAWGPTVGRPSTISNTV